MTRYRGTLFELDFVDKFTDVYILTLHLIVYAMEQRLLVRQAH